MDYYDTPTPVAQVASVSVPDARTLLIQPWDQSILSKIEKAIQKSDLGLDSRQRRQGDPPLDPPAQRGAAPAAREVGRQAGRGVACCRPQRSARGQGSDQGARQGQKLSEDDEKRSETELQKLTDRFVQKVDELLKKKEQEILEF